MLEGGRRKFLESRYALRSLECAIGYDCRRLQDGREARFRHTFLHRRMKMAFFERRDVILMAQASLLSSSSISSSHGADFGSAVEIVSGRRSDLSEALFPYLKRDEPKKIDGQTIDELFDELDEMEDDVEDGS